MNTGKRNTRTSSSSSNIKDGDDNTVNCSKKQKRNVKESDQRKKQVISEEDAEEEVNNLKHSDPVLQLNLTSPSSASSSAIPDITIDIDSSSSLSLLEKLIYPLSPNTFLRSCFRKKAVHVQSNNVKRVSELNSKYMFDLNALRIFEETSSDSIFLWIPSTRSANNNAIKEEENICENTDDGTKSSTKAKSQPLQSIDIQDPEMAHLLHTSSNYASYCRAPPELEQPLVYNMLKDTGIGCGQYEHLNTTTSSMGRGEVETFIGTKHHITDWHIDFQENFTIQLSGCKKWYLKQSTLKHPLRGITPHYKNTKDVIENQLKSTKLSTPDFVYDGKQENDTNSFGSEEVITMNAGDVLYFPAGMWHKVETVEYGVSINISLMGSNYASVICGAMEHLLLKREEWREVICNKTTDAVTTANGSVVTSSSTISQDGDVVIEKLNSLLKDLPDIIHEFRNKGGAHCILPPVLRRAPNYVVGSEEVDEEYDDDNNDGSDNDDNVQSEETSDNEEEDESSPAENDNPSINEIDEDNIIDIKSFHSPENYDFSRPSLNHKLVKNPLATMMKMTDVTPFSSKGEDECDPHERDKNFYILNISYAGNEMHEPSVRTVFHDDSGVLEKLCEIEQSGASDNGEMDIQSASSDTHPPGALFYYGYFNWVQ